MAEIGQEPVLEQPLAGPEPAPDDGVLRRPRPEVDPLGGDTMEVARGRERGRRRADRQEPGQGGAAERAKVRNVAPPKSL